MHTPNMLQTLTVGPDRPTYGDIALSRGVTAAQPFTGGDVQSNEFIIDRANPRLDRGAAKLIAASHQPERRR